MNWITHRVFLEQKCFTSFHKDVVHFCTAFISLYYIHLQSHLTEQDKLQVFDSCFLFYFSFWTTKTGLKT